MKQENYGFSKLRNPRPDEFSFLSINKMSERQILLFKKNEIKNRKLEKYTI